MTTRPTALNEWATSGANIVEPSAGKKAAGWLSGERPPAQFWNWWKRLTYDWVAHLGNTLDRCMEGAGIPIAQGNDRHLWRAIRQHALIDAIFLHTPRDATHIALWSCGIAFVRQGLYGPQPWLIVAATGGTGVRVSNDWGRTWLTPSTLPPSASGFGVALLVTDNIVLLASVGAKVYTSDTTYQTWTLRTSPAGVNTYKDGAVLPAGVCCLINPATGPHYSVDGLAVTWAQGAIPSGFAAATMVAIAAGAGLFVLVDAAKRIATSPTGQTWTVQTAPTDGATAYLDVEYVRALGLFVALAADGAGNRYIHTSSNGTSWQSRGLINNTQVQKLVSTPFGVFAASRYGFLSSIDAINWSDIGSALGLSGRLPDPIGQTVLSVTPLPSGATVELAGFFMLPDTPAATGNVIVAGPVR